MCVCVCVCVCVWARVHVCMHVRVCAYPKGIQGLGGVNLLYVISYALLLSDTIHIKLPCYSSSSTGIPS